MSDDVRERAREAIAGAFADMDPMGEGHPPSALQKSQAETAVAALEAAGIVLVDAAELYGTHAIVTELDQQNRELRDEKRRLLAFRDAHDRRFGQFKHFSDFAEHRAAVADIEP